MSYTKSSTAGSLSLATSPVVPRFGCAILYNSLKNFDTYVCPKGGGLEHAK